MTEKKGKRAVIISNIKSNSIEQAIFILKSPAYDASFDAGSGIVAEAQEIINSYINTIEKNLELPNVVAVGETGLDYYKNFGDKRSQIELFITQLEIAQKHNLPVIIHNRDAGNDLYDILSEHIPDAGAILHCYSENAEYAKKCLDKNIWFSFAGNLTYRNARNLHETVLNIPVERIGCKVCKSLSFILPFPPSFFFFFRANICSSD